MRTVHHLLLTLLFPLLAVGCGSRGIPEPIKVLENPSTGERVRFFREVQYKVPANYDESQHIAEWRKEKQEAGFTKEISPVDDRESLADLRKKNLAASRTAGK